MAEREDQIGNSGEPASSNDQEQFGKWRENFVRIDQAVIESGIVPRLHELFSQRGIDEDYLVLDGVEWPQGPGPFVPFLTRYVMPIFESEQENKAYPGLLVYEIFQLGGGKTLKIQIGLDDEDMWKINQRIKPVLDRVLDREEYSSWENPYWWNFPYYAFDMTRIYNSVPPANPLVNNTKKIEDDLVPFDSFIWGKYSDDERVVSVDFELERKGVVTKLWGDQREDVDQAFANLAEIIDEHLRK